MGINFPATPSVGQLYPDPAQAGVPQYKWDGAAWVSATQGVPTIAVSDTPPSNPIKNMLWWESDSGTLSVYYDDGSGLQWVQAVAVPMSDTAPADGKFYARQGNVWVEVPRYQRVSIAGSRPIDIQVPTNANAVRFSLIAFPTSAALATPYLQISLTPGVFLEAGNYITQGFVHGFTNPTVVGPINVGTFVGFLLANTHGNHTLPALAEGLITLKRPNTTVSFRCKVSGVTYETTGATSHYFGSAYISSAQAQLSVLALRILTDTGDNWDVGSYLNVEWM